MKKVYIIPFFLGLTVVSQAFGSGTPDYSTFKVGIPSKDCDPTLRIMPLTATEALLQKEKQETQEAATALAIAIEDAKQAEDRRKIDALAVREKERDCLTRAIPVFKYLSWGFKGLSYLSGGSATIILSVAGSNDQARLAATVFAAIAVAGDGASDLFSYFYGRLSEAIVAPLIP